MSTALLKGRQVFLYHHSKDNLVGTKSIAFQISRLYPHNFSVPGNNQLTIFFLRAFNQTLNRKLNASRYFVH